MSEPPQTFPDDITYEEIDYFDRYIKCVIINAKRDYYKKRNKAKKHGITMLDFDSLSKEPSDTDNVYLQAVAAYFKVDNIKIPVIDPDFADILTSLSERQRYTVLRYYVLEDSLTYIAKDMNVSLTMAFKYRNKAIEIIKKRMDKIL